MRVASLAQCGAYCSVNPVAIPQLPYSGTEISPRLSQVWHGKGPPPIPRAPLDLWKVLKTEAACFLGSLIIRTSA